MWSWENIKEECVGLLGEGRDERKVAAVLKKRVFVGFSMSTSGDNISMCLASSGLTACRCSITDKVLALSSSALFFVPLYLSFFFVTPQEFVCSRPWRGKTRIWGLGSDIGTRRGLKKERRDGRFKKIVVGGK